MPNKISYEVVQNGKSDVDKYLEYWKKVWSVRDTAWHLDKRHPTLVKYTHLLIGDKNEQKNVLFPLCGKNVDMKWFWENKHVVYGVECADEAITDFFSNNAIPNKLKFLDESTKVFQAEDERLSLIQTNFLTLNDEFINGKIEVVWDRGAFGTITYKEQVLYAQTMKRLLAKKFNYLLLVLEFDDNKFSGLPYSISNQRIHELMGDFCNIQKLESTLPEHLQLYQRHMGSAMEVKETAYLLTDK